MFAAAPGDDAGLAYVREYVGAQLAVGRLPAQILASFGAAQADPGVTVDTAELCRMVLTQLGVPKLVEQLELASGHRRTSMVVLSSRK